MPDTIYPTDQERRQLIGQTLSKPYAKREIITRLNALSSSLYNPDKSPIEQRINKIFIPSKLDYIDDTTNDMLITQTRSPLYEEITNIIYDVLHDDKTQSPPQLLDKRLKPFILNSLFSNRWDATNMPSEILEVMLPFQDNDIVRSVLAHKISSLHPDVAALAAKICATEIIRYNIYNFVETYYDQIKYLADTNPAVITLYVYTQDINAPLEHEGEIVKLIRQHLQNRHPDYPLSTYWKAFSKRSHESIYNHITACAQQNMQYDEDMICTELLIATTIAKTHLKPTTSTWLDHLNDNRFNNLNQRKPILMLLLKESDKYDPGDQWFRNVGRQITNITDYARDMNPDARMTSTNWNGLIARADEWHRNMRANTKMRQHDRYNLKCWNSLIKEPMTFENENIVITPLVNSLELYVESEEVQHCVHMYSEYCVSGKTRLFKIRPINDKTGERDKIGTMEIALRDKEWTVQQVQGLRNHSMNSILDQVASKVARQYTNEWTSLDAVNGERHTTWMEKRTDIPKEEDEVQPNRNEI